MLTTRTASLRHYARLGLGRPVEGVLKRGSTSTSCISTPLGFGRFPNGGSRGGWAIGRVTQFNRSSRQVLTVTVERGPSIPPSAQRAVGVWLLGCAGLVAGMVVVGGATRLTRSGLSMVTWKPHGGLPPLTTAQWMEEFERYQQFPEFQQRKSMTLDEFKYIFWWEYSHRMLGRALGLCFLGPLAYFGMKGQLPKRIHKNLGILAVLGATQGGIGWWMVKSGLEEQQNKRKEVRVSPYRLTTHLSFAVVTFSMLLWTGMDVLSSRRQAESLRGMIDPIGLQHLQKLRRFGIGGVALLLTTMTSGALVAGNDAGRAFNTFPKMDGQWIPEGILEMKPVSKNFFENTATVQFDHRVLATATAACSMAIYAFARRSPMWNQIPTGTKAALNAMLGMTALQVALGISTLLTYVPTNLAIMHQTGALILLSKYWWLLHTLKFVK